MPVRDANELLIGWLIVVRDVTEEQELSKSREQLSEMIVHDLRSPLTAILGSLKLLETLSQNDRSPVVEQALSVSSRSVRQMLGLVNSLLDLARLEAGELELSLTQVSIASLCEELIKTYVQEANESGIILDYTIHGTLPDISADREKIERTLTNLIDNALKFTPAGGRIRIEASEEGENILKVSSPPSPLTDRH